MTMATDRQIYYLGQIYAALCDQLEISDPEKYMMALQHPIFEIIKMYLEFVSGHQTAKNPKYLVEYLSLRFRKLDSNNEFVTGEKILPIDLQATFILAYKQYQVRTDAKTLVSRTGLTQEQLAAKIGVQSNTVSRWCTGERKLSEENRFKIEQLSLEQEDLLK